MSLTDFFNKSRFGRFLRGMKKECGVAAVEFALTMPIWIILLLGCADVAYCNLINQRVDRISYTVGDLVTQTEKIKIADLDGIMVAADQLMKPFSFSDQGRVIVSSVFKPTGGTPSILWQYTGGGTLIRSSRIGLTGQVPVLPNNMTLNDNDNVIVVEVFYTFTPLFLGADLLSAGDVYRITVYKPRLSSLTKTPT